MLFEVSGDGGECLALHIESKNKSHNLGFGGDYLRQAVFALFVTEKLGVGQGDLAVCHTLALPPSHVLRNGAAFFLCQAAHNGNQQFALAVEGVNIFFLKPNLATDLFQFANGGQAVNRVSGKTAYRLVFRDKANQFKASGRFDAKTSGEPDFAVLRIDA